MIWLIGGDYDQGRESLVLSLLFSTSVAVFMISMCLAPPGWQRPFSAGVVRRLGDISYGIYLVHFLLVAYLAELFSMPTDGTPGAFAVWLVAVMPASVVYGYLSARFLEQPVRRWARKFGRRRSE